MLRPQQIQFLEKSLISFNRKISVLSKQKVCKESKLNNSLNNWAGLHMSNIQNWGQIKWINCVVSPCWTYLEWYNDNHNTFIISRQSERETAENLSVPPEFLYSASRDESPVVEYCCNKKKKIDILLFVQWANHTLSTDVWNEHCLLIFEVSSLCDRSTEVRERQDTDRAICLQQKVCLNRIWCVPDTANHFFSLMQWCAEQ